MKICNPKENYSVANHIVYDCKYHIIFTPKYRRPVLINDVENVLKEIIFDKQEEYGYEIIEMEIMPDHVHLLLSIDPRQSPHLVTRKIKGYSAKILRDKFPYLKSKMPSLWTRSAFIATVGSVSLKVVKEYIENQKGYQ